MGCVQSRQAAIIAPRRAAYVVQEKSDAFAVATCWSSFKRFITMLRPSWWEQSQFTREQCLLIEKYMPKYPHTELSTNIHKEIAAEHWMNAYGEEKSNASTSTKRDSINGSSVGQLYDAFYLHLSQANPELLPLFRSSIHVRSRVLVHISVGMRSILTSPNLTETILNLTRTHIKAGVQLTHYQPLADSLFHAMAKTSGPLWTREVANAWQHLYVHCSAFLMVEHQRQQGTLTKKPSGEVNTGSNTTSEQIASVRSEAGTLPVLAPRPITNSSSSTYGKRFVDRLRPFWSKSGENFTREQSTLIETYLPKYALTEVSTNTHKEIAATHWTNSYRDESSANSKRDSSTGSTIGQLYDTFYLYLSEKEPELMPIFRSSMHVRSRVLVHISVGMRSILTSPNLTETILTLTRTHIKAGVQLTHYQPLADSLFHAMAKTSGPLWTREVANAWQHLYVHCSALLMIEHQRQRKALSKIERQTQNGTLNSKSATTAEKVTSDLGTFSVPRGYTGLHRGSKVCSSLGEVVVMSQP